MKTSLEINLQAEVEFWQSLIDDGENEHGGPVHTRLHDALALAEYKLQQIRLASEISKPH